jgi:phosphohistidine phosphatase
VLLYLVRHAIAEQYDPGRWPDDAERPLTDRGVRRFRRAARGLRALAPEVDALLSSRYARAWTTAELLAEHSGWPAPDPLEALTPGHRPPEVLAALEGFAAAATVALVGHNPDLPALASYLLTGAPGALEIEWRRGAVAALDSAGAAGPGAFALRSMLPPRALRRMAGR